MSQHPNLILKIVNQTPEYIEFKCILKGSEYHIDDMPSYRFDLVNYGEIDNIPELIKRIGVAAFSAAQNQYALEKLQESPVSKLKLDSLLNREIVLTLQEVYSGTNMQVTQNG